jgi:hypothetical protein
MRPAYRIVLCAVGMLMFIAVTISSPVSNAQENGNSTIGATASNAPGASGTMPSSSSAASSPSGGMTAPVLAVAPQFGESSSLSLATAEAPLPPPPPSEGGNRTGKIGIGAKISLLGIGIEAATPLSRKLNLRGGFNFLNYSRGLTNDGIHYDGKLNFRSGELHLDWFPFGGGFHLSPGVLFYNGNKLTASASVPGGNTFTLNGTQYESDPTNPITGNGNLTFPKAAPSILVGFGNMLPRSGRHFSFNFEVGGEYQGSPTVALNLQGNACNSSGLNCVNAATDPGVQTNIQGQEKKINHDLAPFKFFPQISLGFGINF